MLAPGRLTVCGQCAARRDLTEADLVPGVAIRGAAAFVEEVMARARRPSSTERAAVSRTSASGRTT